MATGYVGSTKNEQSCHVNCKEGASTATVLITDVYLIDLGRQ